MILRTITMLVAATAIGGLLAGCNQHSTEETVDDILRFNGDLRIIVNLRHYVAPALNIHGSGTMTKQEWALVTIPFPDQPGRFVNRREFLRMGGNYEHMFLSNEGSDLLIHQRSPDATGAQFMLFDPATGRDVSNPLPSKPEPLVFDRSRTACLTLEGKQAVILDTLSAGTGEPRVLVRPPWAAVLERLKYGRIKAVLTEDKQYLVLLPHIESPSFITESNFIVEVFATNGNTEHWSIPLERNREKFVDAESVNGRILLLSRLPLDNGAKDEVKLLSMQGETLCSGKISGSTLDHLWCPKHQEVLFPYYEVSSAALKLPRTFVLWNYASNQVQRISLRR
jgi:hypothetical protein